jgi:hypothetical protein
MRMELQMAQPSAMHLALLKVTQLVPKWAL